MSQSYHQLYKSLTSNITNAVPATPPNGGYQVTGGNCQPQQININWQPQPKKFKDKVNAALKLRKERFISEKLNKLHTRDKNGKWTSNPKKVLLNDLSDKYFCAVGVLSAPPTNPKGVLVFYDGQALDYDKHYFVEDNFILFTFIPEGGLDKSLQVLYTIQDLKENSTAMFGTYSSFNGIHKTYNSHGKTKPKK